MTKWNMAAGQSRRPRSVVAMPTHKSKITIPVLKANRPSTTLRCGDVPEGRQAMPRATSAIPAQRAKGTPAASGLDTNSSWLGTSGTVIKTGRNDDFEPRGHPNDGFLTHSFSCAVAAGVFGRLETEGSRTLKRPIFLQRIAQPHPRRRFGEGRAGAKGRTETTYPFRQLNSTAKTASFALVFLCSWFYYGIRSTSRANEDVAYDPETPLFTSTLTSTRRFSARPAAVSLGAAGSAVPIAPGAMMCRTGTLQSWIK